MWVIEIRLLERQTLESVQHGSVEPICDIGEDEDDTVEV
jgi:hypothetical protein